MIILLQTNSTIHSNEYKQIIPLEGVDERSGGKSNKTPYVISATVIVAGMLDSVEHGNTRFNTNSTRCFQDTLKRMLPRKLLKFVTPPATSKKEEYDSSDDSDSEEDEDHQARTNTKPTIFEESDSDSDKKPAAKKISKSTALTDRDLNAKRKATSNEDTTAKKKKPVIIIPKVDVPAELRGKTITATGHLSHDLTKAKIKDAVSRLESVKYCNKLPVINAMNKASILIVLGTGNDNDLKRIAIRDHDLQTISPAAAAKLLKKYMP